MIDLARYRDAVARSRPLQPLGRVTRLGGLALEAAVAGVRLGEAVEIRTDGDEVLTAEVVALREDRAVLLPLGDARGVGLDAEVRGTGSPFGMRAGEGLRGRIVDGLGSPIDGLPPPAGLEEWAVDRPAPPALSRRRVSEPLPLGVRAIDGLMTVGEGQRVGLFAGSGVGKSVLLGQIARCTRAEVSVICLVGERGREVREFVEDELGAEGLARSVVVVATSDAPALVRLKSAHVATAMAEWFAEHGRRVLLMLDSVTRYARAQREVALAAGELPARHGYPASVFAALPRLLERAGNRSRGGITALYTVLVAGGDMEEPIADEVRGILDGHVVLDRALAARGHFPAIDVLSSVSRSMPAVASEAHRMAATRFRALLAAYERQRDLVAVGAYRRGSDPDADAALERLPALEAFLVQRPERGEAFDSTLSLLNEAIA